MRIGSCVSLAAWRTVLRQHDSLLLSFGDAPVSDQAADIELNLDLVLSLAYLHTAADPIHRHRIAVTVQRDISFDIDHALLQPVDFGNPRRQRFQMQALDGEQLTGNRADMFFVSRVDLVAPLPRPLIQVLPTAEGTSRQKVMLYEMEGTLYARRTVCIPNRVRHELKTETFPKSLHLRHRNHLTAAAAQYDHVRVIDRHSRRGATHVTQRIGEKHFAVETPEVGVTLEEQHSRVTQDSRSGLHFLFPAAQFEFVRRRVVLNLFAGRERRLSRRRWRRLSDSMPPTERR
jgi:hypothetical protein